MRVIFDRSVFHGESFDVLAKSPVQELVTHNRLSVFHTPIFLEETILSYGSKGDTGEWKAHLAFAVELCNGGIFLPKEDIWQSEIVRDHGPAAQHLHPRSDSRHYVSLPRMLHTLQSVAESGDLQKEWHESFAERDEAQEKKTNQRKIFGKLRREVASAIKEGRVGGNPKNYPFPEFLKTEFVHTGRLFMSIVDGITSKELGDRWARNPGRFPFYSAFIEGSLYSAYYAMIENNLPLDRNAQADYEQLAYLLWADVIVSNDQKFFRSAFQTLWAPLGKRMESAQSFAQLVRELA